MNKLLTLFFIGGRRRILGNPMEPGQIAERVNLFQKQLVVRGNKASIGLKPTRLENLRRHRDNKIDMCPP